MSYLTALATKLMRPCGAWFQRIAQTTAALFPSATPAYRYQPVRSVSVHRRLR